ncbi:MAG: ankyrin repeat domain-containing protein [Planctomycetaceae bacterium]
MGAFIVNFHVRSSDVDSVASVLESEDVESAWIAGPQGNWCTFWEAHASLQDSNRINQLASSVSSELNVPVIAFLVHDSDFLCYWLYDNGELIDEYNSCPDYFGETPIEGNAYYEANCQALLRYCIPDTTLSELENLLAQMTQESLLSGDIGSFVFSEQRLAQLAAKLGISDSHAMTNFNDIGRDISAEELGARWIGIGEQPASELVDEDQIEHPQFQIQLPPLHQAAADDDVAEIDRLVAQGVDIDEIPRGFSGTALSMAASRGSLNAIQSLVEHWASLQKSGKEGGSPMHMAVSSGEMEAVRLLAKLGASVNEEIPQVGSLLHFTILMGSAQMLKVLLEAGADTAVTNAAGLTPREVVQMQCDSVEQLKSMMPNLEGPMKMMVERAEQMLAVFREFEG